MFGIGFPELIVILVLIVLVVGPEELPGVVRKGMSFLQEARRHLAEIKESVDKQTEPLKEQLESMQDDIPGGSGPVNPGEGMARTEGRFSDSEPPRRAKEEDLG
ncbi:MAG: twin-arginine translocase TatA/TatE family subunit [Mariprofundaceae bacterium]